MLDADASANEEVKELWEKGDVVIACRCGTERSTARKVARRYWTDPG